MSQLTVGNKGNLRNKNLYFPVPKSFYEKFVNKKWVERFDVFESKQDFARKVEKVWRESNDAKRDMFMKAPPPPPTKSHINYFFKPKQSRSGQSSSTNTASKSSTTTTPKSTPIAASASITTPPKLIAKQMLILRLKTENYF